MSIDNLTMKFSRSLVKTFNLSQKSLIVYLTPFQMFGPNVAIFFSSTALHHVSRPASRVPSGISILDEGCQVFVGTAVSDSRFRQKHAILIKNWNSWWNSWRGEMQLYSLTFPFSHWTFFVASSNWWCKSWIRRSFLSSITESVAHRGLHNLVPVLWHSTYAWH